MLCAGAVVSLTAMMPTTRDARPEPEEWRDRSAHRTQMVTVDTGVQLEVLDWGGTGRPLLLLAGSGNTAHVFDDFAPRLTALGRVLAVTRRGFGASSAPAAGYDVDRLGEDIQQILVALDLSRVVLIGHSIAGQELSWVATRHAERVAGLVYIDAAYRYALHRPGILENVQDLRSRLQALEAEIAKPPRPPAELSASIRTVMGDALEEVQRDLQDLRATPPFPGAAPAAAATDLQSVQAYQAWARKTMGFVLPEAELRWQRTVLEDGRVGAQRTPAAAAQAMASTGAQRFTSIDAPALAIYASPHGLGPWSEQPGVDRVRVDAFRRFDARMTERQARWFEQRVPGSRVVRIPNASHYAFLSHAEDVLREIDAFLRTLP